MGKLFSRIVTFPNLWLAAKRASRGKRFRANVSSFRLRLEEELLFLQEELSQQAYQPGPYRQFVIRDKKPRLISAAPFRDRVVHHALCQIIEPIFEQRFVYDSYACRKGKGTHAAIERASAYARCYPYVLKCDLAAFFPSVDHEVLLSILQRRIWDQEILWLIGVILKSGGSLLGPEWYFLGDDLFSPVQRVRGLPIGNQTSQFFGNVYLDPLDHFVKEQLRAPGYVRYVDDFLVFAKDKPTLHAWHEAIGGWCDRFRVRLHPRKCFVAPVASGISFLGHRIFPTYRRLDAGNVKRFRRRLRGWNQAVRDGELSLDQAWSRVQSWLAHAKHSKTFHLRQRIVESVPWLGFARAGGVGQEK